MIHARHDTSRRVLLVGEAVTLAHVARPIALARKLVARGYRPVLAADPRFAALCPAEEWDTAAIRSIPSADFLRALARGQPVYDLATLERYVADDLALLRAVRPSVVIGDFRISLAVSARLSGVPYINITNAYWSPYARPRWHAPTMPWSRHLPAALDDGLFRAARPLAFRLHARPMQALARRHGLPHAGKDLRHVYTDGDLTLYADSPAIVATYDRPSTHRYLGLIDWAPSAPLPPWWDALPATARPIYVTLGSSGDVAKLPRVLAGLARLGCPVVVAMAGASAPASLPAHVHVADYLPGEHRGPAKLPRRLQRRQSDQPSGAPRRRARARNSGQSGPGVEHELSEECRRRRLVGATGHLGRRQRAARTPAAGGSATRGPCGFARSRREEQDHHGHARTGHQRAVFGAGRHVRSRGALRMEKSSVEPVRHFDRLNQSLVVRRRPASSLASASSCRTRTSCRRLPIRPRIECADLPRLSASGRGGRGPMPPAMPSSSTSSSSRGPASPAARLRPYGCRLPWRRSAPAGLRDGGR